MLEYQEFPISMVGKKKSDGWRLVGPCRPYSLDGYSVWMERGEMETRVCEAIVRLPGESAGADIETNKAAEWGVPLRTIAELL